MAKTRVLKEIITIVETGLLILFYSMYLGPQLVEKNLMHDSPTSQYYLILMGLIPIVFLFAGIRMFFNRGSLQRYSFVIFWLFNSYHAIIVSVWFLVFISLYVLSPLLGTGFLFLIVLLADTKLLLKRTPKMLAEDFQMFYQACVKGTVTFLPAFVKGCKDFYSVLKGRDMKPFFLFLCFTFLFGGVAIELFKWLLNSIFN